MSRVHVEFNSRCCFSHKNGYFRAHIQLKTYQTDRLKEAQVGGQQLKLK